MKRTKSYLKGGLGITLAASLTLLVGPFFPSIGGADVRSLSHGGRSDRDVAPSRAPAVGIKVHARWIIEVRDPDGTLVSHREFENALDSAGIATLTELLTRSRSMGSMAIALGGTLCGSEGCVICTNQDQTNDLFPACDVFNLGRSVPDTGTNAGKLVLEGTFSSFFAGNIDEVRTLTRVCDSTVTTAQCFSTADRGPGEIFSDFTGTTLTPPVDVPAADRVIQVIVIISFS